MANTKKIDETVNNKELEIVEKPVKTVDEGVNGTIEKPVEESKPKSKTANDIDAINSVVNSLSSEEVAAEEVGAKAKPDNNKEIPVKSVTFGGLTWISSKTNSYYRWNEIGAVEYIPFGELITMNNTSRDFLFDPLVILLDEDAAKYFRLDTVYKNFACVNRLEELFKSGDLAKIESELNKIKTTKMRNVAISRIRTLYDEGKLTNINIIKLVEKMLCFDLSELTGR